MLIILFDDKYFNIGAKKITEFDPCDNIKKKICFEKLRNNEKLYHICVLLMCVCVCVCT